MKLSAKATGLDRLIDDLTDLKSTSPQGSVTEKMRKLIERLMYEAYPIAEMGFAKALYEGDNDVVVKEPYWDGDTMILEANGEAVAFIEFGTGMAEPEQYPDDSAYDALGLSRRGQFGKGHGAKPPWYYPMEKTTGNKGHPKRLPNGKYSEKWICAFGNPPARAMYDASKVFDREHVLEVAREVFNERY